MSIYSFCVVAGKYEDGEINYKYISEHFSTFGEAYAAYLTAKDYPFCEIEMYKRSGEKICSLNVVI